MIKDPIISFVRYHDSSQVTHIARDGDTTLCGRQWHVRVSSNRQKLTRQVNCPACRGIYSLAGNSVDPIIDLELIGRARNVLRGELGDIGMAIALTAASRIGAESVLRSVFTAIATREAELAS